MIIPEPEICNHTECIDAYQSLERIVEVLSTNARPFCQKYQEKIQIILDRAYERCLVLEKKKTFNFDKKNEEANTFNRNCDHMQKSHVCFYPQCNNQSNRKCCANCLTRLHGACKTDIYSHDISEIKVDFSSHKFTHKADKILETFHKELQKIEDRLRNFLNSVERKFNSEVVFSDGYNLDEFLKNLPHFDIFPRNPQKVDSQVYFEYKNNDLLINYFDLIGDCLNKKVIQNFEKDERGFYMTSTLLYVLNDRLNVDTNQQFLQEFVKCIQEKIEKVNNDEINENEKKMNESVFYGGHDLKDYWQIEDDFVSPCELYQFGMNEEKSFAVETIRRGLEKFSKDEEEMSLLKSVEKDMNSDKLVDSGWVCEVFKDDFPVIARHLKKWLIFTTNTKSVFLYR